MSQIKETKKCFFEDICDKSWCRLYSFECVGSSNCYDKSKVTKENVTIENELLQCPHLATHGLSRFCLYGKFPANCEDCNCPDKKYIEITTTNKIE